MENKNTVKDKCPLCHNKNIYDIRKRFEYTLCVCRECDFLFVKENFNYSDYYNKHYFDSYGDAEVLFNKNIKKEGDFSYGGGRIMHESVYNNIFRIVEKFKKIKNTNILDIGCAEGFGLILAKKMGANVFGIDVSQEVILECKKNGLEHVYAGELIDVPFKKIDIAIMNDVLEHMQDPNRNLLVLNKIMNKSGIVFVKNNLFSVDSFRNDENYFLRQFEPPYHCSYFSKEGMIKIFSDHGFKLIYQKPKIIRFMFEFYAFLKRMFSRKQRKMYVDNKKARLSKDVGTQYSAGSFVGKFVNDMFPSGFVFKKIRNI
jgi:SAM-dependent methyltransferase